MQHATPPEPRGLRSSSPAPRPRHPLGALVVAPDAAASAAAPSAPTEAAASAGPAAATTTPAAASGMPPGPAAGPRRRVGTGRHLRGPGLRDVSSSQVLDLWLPTPAAAVPARHLRPRRRLQGRRQGDGGGQRRGGPRRGLRRGEPGLPALGEALFPAAVQDVKAAVRWLRANAAEYGIDPERFAAWGESAGGYLAAMLGTTGDQATIFDDPALGNADVSSAVQAVVDWYGPTDFLQMDAQFAAAAPAACNGQTQAHDPADSPESVYLGAAIQTVPDAAAAANPITYIPTAKSLPAFSIAHGDSDCLVPNQQSAILQDALQAAGATSTFTLVEGASHGDQAITSAQTPVALEMLASVFGK